MLLRCTLCLLIYAAAVLDTSAPLLPGMVSIHWLALVAIGISWKMSPAEATLWAALIGFVADAASAHRMGVELLTCSALASLLATIRQKWECRSLLSLVLLATAMAGGLLTGPLMARWLEGEVDGLRTHVHAVVGSAVATGIAAVLIAAGGRVLHGCSNACPAPARL
jgi:rod shape-determining protein MreD